MLDVEHFYASWCSDQESHVWPSFSFLPTHLWFLCLLSLENFASQVLSVRVTWRPCACNLIHDMLLYCHSISKKCLSLGIVYVYSAEVYPTVLRQIGVGSCSVAGRAGSIIAPFIKEFVSCVIYHHISFFISLSMSDGFIFLFPFIFTVFIPTVWNMSSWMEQKRLVSQALDSQWAYSVYFLFWRQLWP